MYIYLFGTFTVFVVSWLVYSSYLIAPTRVVFYFIVPLSYFTTILISQFRHFQKLIVLLIIFIMIISSYNGVDTMLYTNKCVTKDEYEFLENSKTINEFDYEEYGIWWADFPLRSALLLRGVYRNPTFIPDLSYAETESKAISDINNTLPTIIKIKYDNGTTITKIIPPVFKYVILSPRMEQHGFFMIYTKYRTIQVYDPIPDIWKDSWGWELVEVYRNIKVYKWIGDT
jgi:hypothetical protein